MTERPIGSTFDDPKYGKIQVVEGTTSCNGCVYADMLRRNVMCNIFLTGYCHEAFRSDKKNVCFKHVDNDLYTQKMSEFETRPVGSVFNHPEHGLLQVIESCTCDGCVFYNKARIIPCQADISVGYCTDRKREDKNSVIFKQYTKNGKQSGR